MTTQNPAQAVSDSVIARLAWKHLSQKDARSLTFERSGGLVPQVSIDVPTVELTNFALALIEEANAARELQQAQVLDDAYMELDEDGNPRYRLKPVQQAQVVGEAWQKGYRSGVEDERTSEANIGIAGYGAKIEPARANPYTTPQSSAPVVDDEMVAKAYRVCEDFIEEHGDGYINDLDDGQWNEMLRAALTAALGKGEG